LKGCAALPVNRNDQNGRIGLLSRVDVLELLASQELERLARRTPERSFARGDMVYAAGDAPGSLSLLLTGRIRLYETAGGHEFTFGVLQAGTVFGESSLAGRPQPEYAQALEPARVGVLDLKTFWQLVRDNPEVNQRVMKLLVERAYAKRGRMTDLALKGVRARLAGILLNLLQDEGVVTREGHYRIPTRYTHEDLAAMIGAKRVAVSRAFGNLRELGCVRQSSRQIYVTDLAALRGVAEEV
jgi:CRP/FNR family transcriptional regulator, cyclic AMP receptor protein